MKFKACLERCSLKRRFTADALSDLESRTYSGVEPISYEAVFISKILFTVCRFNYVCLTFNYVFLSFNYYISSCLLDIQLCSILSFNYYFLSLNYPWSFSHLIITVCHAISYFMNFIELWLVAIQLFNIDSISIDRLYLSPKKHRR